MQFFLFVVDPEELTPISAAEILAGEEEVGIEGWNEFEDSYGFVYAKRTEKGEKRRVLVKCLPVGDVLAVDALCLDRDQKEPLNLQIK